MYCEQDRKKKPLSGHVISGHVFDTCKKGFINKQGSNKNKIAKDVEKPL